MEKIDNKNKQNEYYLTDAIEILNSEGLKVSAFKIDNSEEISGVNSREQLAVVSKIMQKRINKFHLDNGVTIVDPDNTYIEPNVTIGYDTVIYPGAIIETNSIIGQNCKIVGNTRIVNSAIGDGCEIESTLIESSTIGSNCHIGPYAHLRPNCKIGNNVKIGNFVEIKNSSIGDNSKAAHLSYVGDADVGKNVNIGCGVVFVNYDGKNKFRSTVEDNAFIGSNSNLIAPVVIEKYGYVAAGSTITDDVNEGDLSIARARQVNIPGWVEKKGLKNHK
jgi:bifunctional UDP-N-acetylglucosamine pyrophosphorylase/glucosamine-1-phosphate N-acetyltransferase